MRRAGWRPAATLLALVALACGGGGGGGGGPTQPPPGITYSPSGSAAANTITLALADASTSQLSLTVQATQVTALYGVAFDVVFPSNLLSFSSATPGVFLSGVATSFQAREVSPGRLVIGFSRLGNVPGATGSGPLVHLAFASRGVAGTGSLTFEKEHAFNSSAVEISSISWSGGSVGVVP